MQNVDEIVRSTLLDPYGIDDSDLQSMLGQVICSGIEMGDIYFQSAEAESWTLEDGEVKKSSYSSRQGAGFRSIIGEQTGLAYSESFDKQSLMAAAINDCLSKDSEYAKPVCSPIMDLKPAPCLLE